MPIQYLNCFRIGYFFISVTLFKEDMYNVKLIREIWQENGLLDISKKFKRIPSKFFVLSALIIIFIENHGHIDAIFWITTNGPA